ncbi:MAG: hypothetical protein RQ801_14275, partial [Spirochaetaceae bacterium]|nr:hypothetical protein [Spirochaetaceae bacterium]
MSAQVKANEKKKISIGRFTVGVVLLAIVLLWTIPTFGIFITSFRDSKDIYGSGWWTILPHKDLVKVDEFALPDSTDPDEPITIEGRTASFEEWRAGIAISEERTLKWYGNKRSRKIEVYQEKWIGFGA